MKEKRQNRIREIIESKDIETQDELLEELKKEGFKITQATISRDMREMKLTKYLGFGTVNRSMQCLEILMPVWNRNTRRF